MLCRCRRFLFAVSLLLYLCRDSTTMKPKFSLTTDQIILKEGEPLQLLHSGDSSSIFFTYPMNGTNIYHTLAAHTSPIKINVTQDEYGTYWYEFLRPKTVFGDTGWYTCSYHPTLTVRRNFSDPTNSRIYVYVESEPVRFAEQAKLHSIVAYHDEDVIIPCRPTSPTAEVQITGYIQETNEKFDFTSTFNRKFGFTLLEKIDSQTLVMFKCTIAPDEEVSYILHMRWRNPLPVPVINNTFPHLVIGESLYMKCTINGLMDLQDYEIFWIIPQRRRGITTWTEDGINPYYYFEKAALLEVKNVNYWDEDIYECRVTNNDTEEKSQMYLRVHESIDPFIYLTTQDPNTHYQRHVGDKVEWAVDVEAYPTPTLIWRNIHGDKIPMTLWKPGGSKYSPDYRCCKPTLKIDSLGFNDMGVYSIEADNQYKTESLNFTLDVLAKPKLYMSKPSSYYFHNQLAKVECHVEAFPKPNITWSYRKCPNYPSCDYGTFEYLTNSKENGTVTHLVSTVSTTLEMSGELTCSACNIVGCRDVTENISVSDDVGQFGIILTTNSVAEDDEWVLICAASIHNYSDNFDWSSESGPIVQSDRISIDRGRTQFSYRSILKIHNVKIEDSQEYICTGRSTGNLTRFAGYRLEVKAAQAPMITDTNLKNGEIIIDLNTRDQKRIDFHCYVNGTPKPSISWFKDGTQMVISNNKHKFSNNFQNLELEYPLEVDSGKYMCRAENRIGKVEVSQRIMVKGFDIVTNIPIGMIILIIMLVVVVLILMIYFALKCRRDRIIRKELTEAGLMHFEKGAVESLNPFLTVDDQADLLPYDKKWEFPREKLKLGKHLGSGAFGVVLKAEALGISKGEAVTTVAVKMVRRAPNLMYISALASELKIMVHLGKHLNVVNLLGACTKNILKRELLVIVEFCRFGNLHKYLLMQRSSFINQINPATGKFDFSIGLDLLTKTDVVCSTNRVKSAELSPSISINRNSESESVQCDSATTDPQGVSMLADNRVLNNGSTQHEWSNCQGDYEESKLKPICTQDLLSWAFQVARGMEYLSQRRILHGDLAARNILLADDNVVKICDFGLAKSMYKEEIYKKKSDCPLPIKWLAIETMRDRIFSTQSDIWSFGIVLWEFFTLAKTPYPGIETELVYQKLIEGYRMEQPEYAIPEVYDIMYQCWKEKPALRPSFTELVGSLGNLLEDNVRVHYIQLNAPNLDMNKTLLEGGKTDYLTMVSAPNHVVCSSLNQDCGNSAASGSATDSGYSGMNPKDAVESSPMLNKEEEDPYLKPINFHERI